MTSTAAELAALTVREAFVVSVIDRMIEPPRAGSDDYPEGRHDGWNSALVAVRKVILDEARAW